MKKILLVILLGVFSIPVQAEQKKTIKKAKPVASAATAATSTAPPTEAGYNSEPGKMQPNRVARHATTLSPKHLDKSAFRGVASVPAKTKNNGTTNGDSSQ